MSETKPDTVPGLGFKNKEKALETIQNLEGRDPDYQRLAIKGLIGRAKRTLTLTKDKEKLQNINEAMSVFDEWLNNFEKQGLSKENRAYLPYTTIEVFFSLKKRYNIECKTNDEFLKAYKEAGGDYKNLRTVSSGENEQTWDIVRNNELKKLLNNIEENKSDLWENDLPSKSHTELILWAYSPDASKIKKNLSSLKEMLEAENTDEDDIKNAENVKAKSGNHKRKSDSENTDEEETPKKKKKN